LAYFSGEKNFSTRDISYTFVVAQRNLAALGVWPIKTYFQNFVSFGPGLRDIMRRHASILHWCTCEVVFRQLPYVCRYFCFYSLRCPRIRCKLYLQVSRTARQFIRQHDLLVMSEISLVELNYHMQTCFLLFKQKTALTHAAWLSANRSSAQRMMIS